MTAENACPLLDMHKQLRHLNDANETITGMKAEASYLEAVASNSTCDSAICLGPRQISEQHYYGGLGTNGSAAWE